MVSGEDFPFKKHHSIDTGEIPAFVSDEKKPEQEICPSPTPWCRPCGRGHGDRKSSGYNMWVKQE